MLAATSQDRTLSTIRGTEVVSDPTNVLALLCAERLRVRSQKSVRLCTVHQVLRAQPLPPQPGFSRHFRLFALGEAGPGEPDDGFELSAIVRHLTCFHRLFRAATEAMGCQFQNQKLILRTEPGREVLRERVQRRLKEAFPRIELSTEEFASNYYAGLRILFGAETSTGDFCPVADLGLFDWVGQLVANRRTRFVASGFGLQLLPAVFAAR